MKGLPSFSFFRTWFFPYQYSSFMALLFSLLPIPATEGEKIVDILLEHGNVSE
jgi:hypothetical protein